MKKALKIGCLSILGVVTVIIIISYLIFSYVDSPDPTPENLEYKGTSIPVEKYYKEALSQVASENFVLANETLKKIITIDSSFPKIDTLRIAITDQYENAVKDFDKKIKYFESISYKTKDEFQSTTFYEPNSEKGKYGNTIYSYFSVNDNGTVSNPRIVIRYYGDNWIFWNKVIFSIDGNTYNYVPSRRPDRDNGSGSVWEKIDLPLTTGMYEITQKFFEAEKVRYRLKGEHIKDFTLSESKINSIKDMINYCYFLQNQENILNFKVN